ncbi:MAG TPA: xanthine dehydrogenase family protein subunit M [Euzebyales bacterium]|nr:xanthine dehydrogenase family protein subunit M [Euzebyales bacterium]
MQVPAPFEYARATSVDHALALLAERGEEARIIAGGHSLLPMMKLRLVRPELLIDINDCVDLDHITEDGDTLRIGALTRHAALLASDTIGRLVPMMVDAEHVIADPVVRNRGTIGGSLCQADPGEDLSTVCDAMFAEVVIRGRDGERTVPMDDLHRGPYETAVEQDEIMTEIRIPVRPGAGSAYEKVERRIGDWAIAAAGVSVWMTNGTIDDVGIGLTAVGLDDGLATAAQDAVRGRAPDEDLYAEAGKLAAEQCDPVDDQRGSATYKRHLTAELTTRALRRAVERARTA